MQRRSWGKACPCCCLDGAVRRRTRDRRRLLGGTSRIAPRRSSSGLESGVHPLGRCATRPRFQPPYYGNLQYPGRSELFSATSLEALLDRRAVGGASLDSFTARAVLDPALEVESEFGHRPLEIADIGFRLDGCPAAPAFEHTIRFQRRRFVDLNPHAGGALNYVKELPERDEDQRQHHRAHMNQREEVVVGALQQHAREGQQQSGYRDDYEGDKRKQVVPE